jgi:hypothetical protein
MIESIIFDVDMEIMENDYSPEFMEKMGIISYIPTGILPGNGYIEIMMIFKNKEYRDRYILEFDMDFQEMIYGDIKSASDIYFQ